MVPFIGAAQEFVNYAIDPGLSKACLQQICSKQNLYSFSRDTVLQIKSAFITKSHSHMYKMLL
jgi:hypothetical protein